MFLNMTILTIRFGFSRTPAPNVSLRKVYSRLLLTTPNRHVTITHNNYETKTFLRTAQGPIGEKRTMKYDIRKLTTCAVTAAVVFLVTWTVKFPVPGTSGGYLNFGDVVIYISALLLGGPAAAVSAAIGSGFADLAAGSVVYIPATFVIKGLMGLLCGAIAYQKSFMRYVIACAIGGAVMTTGYYLYELIMFGAEYAALSIPFNLIQWIGSAVAAVVLFPAVKRLSAVINTGSGAK